jgi:hypothetical protein
MPLRIQNEKLPEPPHRIPKTDSRICAARDAQSTARCQDSMRYVSHFTSSIANTLFTGAPRLLPCGQAASFNAGLPAARV